MKRAAIIIGVDKTGDLPRLNDAATGAELMGAWAREQGIDTTVITDADGPVEVSVIKKAIRQQVDSATLDQLVVYFAGHGVNLQRHEYWLLSDAPDDPQAAVNVAGSATLAATCGIPHIVFISDACRTAAEGIRAQSVTGSEIFPNRESDKEMPVDQFFACQLGRPSHEVRDPTISSAEYRALYTRELIPALNGYAQAVVDWTGKDGYVHLRSLRDYLSIAMTSRLAGMQLLSKVVQIPTAQINSDPPIWISHIVRAEDEPVPVAGGPGLAGEKKDFLLPRDLEPSVLSQRLGYSPSVPKLGDLFLPLGYPPNLFVSHEESELCESVHRLATPFGVGLHETKCGFKIRGGRFSEVLFVGFKAEFTSPEGAARDDIRIDIRSRESAPALLVLEDGSGIMLPAIPGFLGAVTMEEGELVDVSYEPSQNSWLWDEYAAKAARLRSLRARASASMSRGLFKIEGDDALGIAREMQYAKGVDPTLALYSAYTYHDMQRLDLIREIKGYMEKGELGESFFDVALLAKSLNQQTVTEAHLYLSPFPLISQGWALLQAYSVRLHPDLQPLAKTLLPSLWTLFNPQGVEIIRTAIQKGVIK